MKRPWLLCFVFLIVFLLLRGSQCSVFLPGCSIDGLCTHFPVERAGCFVL